MSIDIEQKNQEIENTESAEMMESISATEEIIETNEFIPYLDQILTYES